MKINRELCDVCGTCVAVCPADAIIVSEFKVTINNEKCIHCQNCLKVCPIKAISEGEA
ncbi:MAG TPA: 4Fe-4S binding protein [Candidatus Cloacimonadota bacterium]|nr:4Fe-4S binding protein [Candidatus Cloacimonadota bacterium]